MGSIRMFMLLAAGVLLASPVVQAADIARLEWGAFIVVDDSSNGWSETKSLPSDDGRSVTLSLSTLEARAETEGATDVAVITGRYDVSQPPGERVVSCRVDIEGHVIKNGSTAARLKVMIAGMEQMIEWSPDQAASEKFRRSLVFALPDGGRIPAPLDVGIEVFAGKPGKDGAAYISVSSVTVTAEWTKLAGQ